MPYEKTCPKCGQVMQEGWLVDQGFGAYHMTSWVPGPAQPSFWHGLKVDRQAIHRVVAYRCTACGLLESYAIPTSQA